MLTPLDRHRLTLGFSLLIATLTLTGFAAGVVNGDWRGFGFTVLFSAIAVLMAVVLADCGLKFWNAWRSM